MIPGYGQKLNDNVPLLQQVWNETAQTLQLTTPPVINMEGKTTDAPAAQPEKAAPSAKHDMAL